MSERAEECIELVRALEARVRLLEQYNAADNQQLKSISARLNQIEHHMTWVIRLLVGAILSAVVTFALNGGLKL